MQQALIIFYYILWLLHILCVLLKKKWKALSVITFLLMGFIYILNSASDWSDAQIYKNDYEMGIYGNYWVEPGYILFRSFFQMIGVKNFNVYLFFVFLITNYFIYKGITPYTKNFHAIFSIVMGYIWVGQNQGIRFYIAGSIMFYGMHYLIDNKLLKYYLFVILASFIHRSLLFMLLYPLFIYLVKQVKLVLSEGKPIRRKILLTVSGVICLLLFAFNGIPGIELLSNLIGSISKEAANKIRFYGSTLTRWGGVMYILIFFTMLFCSMIFAKKNKSIINLLEREKAETMLDIVYATSMFMPLLIINIEFRRFLLIPALICGILISRYCEYRERYCGKGLVFSFSSNDLICSFFFILVVIAWYLPTLFGMINERITIEYAIHNLTIFQYQ